MAKIFHDPADFPVFTFADSDCQPRIAWHLAVQCCDHLAIADAVNRHPIFQRDQFGRINLALDAHPVFPAPAGGWQFKMTGKIAVIGH